MQRVDGELVLRLHEDAAQHAHVVAVAHVARVQRGERVGRHAQRRQEPRVVGIVHRGVQHALRGGVDLRQRASARCVRDDVELGAQVQRPALVGGEPVGERARRAQPRGEDRPEAVVGLQRQHLQRQPQRAGRGARPRALEADLAQVQLVGREVRVRRVVLVEAADARVGEDHRAAAVGLQPVLVRIDDDRVAVPDRAERRLGDQAGPGQEREEPAVGGVDVDAHAVALAPAERLVDRVDRADAGRPRREDDGADLPRPHLRLDRVEVGAAVGQRGHGARLDAEHLAHAPVRVVRVGGVHDRLARMQLARDPQRLEVGDRPARGQMPERRRLEAEHPREPLDDLDLHRARRLAGVERVVVGVDEHRGVVGRGRDGVRGLDHLPRVARMEERDHRVHPLRVLAPRVGEAPDVGGGRGVGLVRAPHVLPAHEQVDRGAGQLAQGVMACTHARRVARPGPAAGRAVWARPARYVLRQSAAGAERLPDA